MQGFEHESQEDWPKSQILNAHPYFAPANKASNKVQHMGFMPCTMCLFKDMLSSLKVSGS